jgi:predicted branched-subunit amino acid permease
MKHLPQRWLVPLAFWLTDESFLVVAERFRQPDDSPHKHWFFLGSALFMYLNWQLCTWIGIVAGQALPNPASWGLDFALVVTFIGMLAPGLRNRPVIACVLAAGAAAILLAGLPNRLGLIAASLVGVAAGMLAERGRAAR